MAHNASTKSDKGNNRCHYTDGKARVAFCSSNLACVELEVATGDALVEFASGSRYVYANVTPAMLEAWAAAPSAGRWFHAHIKSKTDAHPSRRALGHVPQPLTDERLFPDLGANRSRMIASSEFGDAPDQHGPWCKPGCACQLECPHTLLRSLAGGVACPACLEIARHADGALERQLRATLVALPQRAPIATPSGVGSSAGLVVRSESHGEVTTDGTSDAAEALTGFKSQPPPTVRPPLKHAYPSSSSGAVHGPGDDPPAYMRRALTTLTRIEATRLLTRLGARRMRARFRDFVRGAVFNNGLRAPGAFHALEPGVELEWNFHHDALCDHVQLMLEEWMLSGLQDPAEVDATLAGWLQAADDETRRKYVLDMLVHWATIQAAGGDRYTQRAQDLAINVGPISLKSRIVMVCAPAWMWLHVPGWEVFCSSGTPSNVSRDSLACRDLVTSEWYRDTFGIEWSIRDDLNRVDKWATTVGGSREARGTSAGVTGIHADAVFLDDPDDAKNVWGDAARRDVMAFWLALGNRLKDIKRPVRLVVQQNLMDQDLTTRLCAEGMPRIAIPVEFDPTRRAELYTAPFGWRDPRTVAGELIHVARFPPRVIAAERKRLGTHGFEAQYNCNPRPLDGGMIKRSWFRFFRIEDPTDDERAHPRPRPSGCVGSGGELGTIEMHPAIVLKKKRKAAPRRNDVPWLDGEIAALLELDWLTITVDSTFGSLKDTASAVGLLVVGGRAQRRYVFDDTTAPRTFHQCVAAIKALIAKWPARRVLIEMKANGSSVIDELRKQMADGTVVGPDGRPTVVVIEALEVEGGKESRAAAMVPAIEAGMVYLLEGAAWLEDFLSEICVFPHAKRDDRIDALSQLMTRYRETDAVARWRRMGGK